MENGIAINIDNLNINDNVNVSVEKKTFEKEDKIQEGNTMSQQENNIPENLQVIGNLKSAMFGGFVKILGFLSQGTGSQDIIYIKEGKLNLVKNAGFLFCDLSIMFDKNDFEIIDPSKSIKLLNLIKGGDEVLFVKDDVNQRYIVSNLIEGNVSTSITLPQPDRSITQEVSKPEIGTLKFRREIENDVVDNIQNAVKTLESQYLKIKLQDNVLISVQTSDDIFEHTFQQPDPNKEAPKVYRVFNPFPITKADEVYLEIHQDEENDKLWIKTLNSIGMVTVEYIEPIETMGEFDALML